MPHLSWGRRQGIPTERGGLRRAAADFSDCAFASGEPDPDWQAVVHQGGPVRALDRHMPAFGEALSADDIAAVVSHLRGNFCADDVWPRGDLNFPRALFTEKAYPENEAVWTTAFEGGDDSRGVSNELLYERRFGRRNQLEIKAPISFQRDSSGSWRRGLGDITLGAKRTLYASTEAGRIMSVGGEVILPTGDETVGLGRGYGVFEGFVSAGQAVGAASFVQMQAGFEAPTDQVRGANEGFWRTAVGTTFAEDRGFGRAWTPMVELLVAKADREAAAVDVVPQVQVTLSKLQHVMVSTGVRVPLTDRSTRQVQWVSYLLWDWFDGSLFDFWR